MLSRRSILLGAGLGLSGILMANGKRSLFSANDTHSFPDEWIWCAKGSSNPGGGTAHIFGLNPAKHELKAIEVPFSAHDIAFHPINQSIAASTMKWGNAGAVFSTDLGKVIQHLQSPVGLRYFGHNQWSKDGHFLYCVGNDDKRQCGVLLVYSAIDWKLKHVIDVAGCNPHQIRWVGDRLIVLSQNGPRQASWFSAVNTEQLKVEQSWSLETQSFAHWAHSSESHRYWVGGFSGRYDNPGPGLLATSDGNRASQLTLPKNDNDQPILGEVLSLQIGVVNGSEFLGLTITQSNFTGIFDLLQNAFLNIQSEIKSPRGIGFSVRSPGLVYVNDLSNWLHICRIKDGKLLELAKLSFAGGSHLVVTQS